MDSLRLRCTERTRSVGPFEEILWACGGTFPYGRGSEMAASNCSTATRVAPKEIESLRLRCTERTRSVGPFEEILWACGGTFPYGRGSEMTASKRSTATRVAP